MTRKIFLIMVAVLIGLCVFNVIEISARRAYMSEDGRYITYGGIVIWDTKTYLEWVAGPDKNTTWNQAKSWVANLTVDGGGWRMPTISELKGIYQKKVGTRNMDPFLKTTGWNVWSSETRSSLMPLGFYFKLGVVTTATARESFTSRAFAVRLKRIETEEGQDIEPSVKEAKQQLEIIPVVPSDYLIDTQILLAVLPWKLLGPASMWNHHTISGLRNALYLNKSFAAIYSYYDLRTEPNPKLLDKDVMDGNIFWKQEMGIERISAKPSVDLVCELGQKLGVDAVLMSAIYVEMSKSIFGCIKVILINVKTKKIFQNEACVEDFEAEGETTFMALSNYLLNKYIE